MLPAAAREPAPLVPNDALYALNRAGLESMSVPLAWRITQGDPRVVVAVVDTGVDDEPDLTANLLPGFNALDGGTDTSDEHGHGTEQAALIASVIDNGLGTAGICGRCRILPVKVFGRDGRGDIETVARGIRWASEHGARVVNMSFALEPGEPRAPVVDDAIADALARGVTVVAGAGNNGSADLRANAIAAWNPQAIRVASIDAQTHRLDAVSNRGGWVDVAASAELTARRSAAVKGNGGTSAAAAAVSAISGLMLSCNPDLSPAQVKELLIRTSTPYDVDVIARGEVDAYDAVLASGCEAPDELELDADERFRLTLVVQGSGSVSRQPAARSYEPGTIVTLQAKPRPGWHFAGWRGPCAGKRETCRLTISRTVTVTAVFRR